MYRYNKIEKVAAMNPDQIIEFIGSNFDKKKDADNIEDTQYTLTVHDLLSAFSDFDPARRVVTIKTKTEARAQIPIGRIAAGLLLRTPFTVGPNEGSVLFSKLCRELLIDDLTFHDARSSALTWMARRADVMTLARISRHRDLKILMAHYYRETPDQIAARI